MTLLTLYTCFNQVKMLSWTIKSLLRVSTIFVNNNVPVNKKSLSRILVCNHTNFFCTAPINSNDTNQMGEPLSLSDEEINLLSKGDEELKKKLKLIVFEYEVNKQEGISVPSKVTLDQWKELLEKDSRKSRQKYFRFLFINEMKKVNEKAKKEEKAKQREAEKELNKADRCVNESHIQYGLGKNTIFLKIYDTKIDHFHNSKCINALIHDIPLIFDMGYCNIMTKREQQNAAQQLVITFSENREHTRPFGLHFCNADLESELMKRLHKQIPSLHSPDFPINISSKSYLDLFPKEKLVYLTPHCRNEMTEFDNDRIYIVGALVDKSCAEPVSLAKAKRENIEMAKLPLDKYLDWGSGSGKSLTLNQMVNILLEIRLTGDWEKALRFVPKRKLKTEKELQQELIYKETKYNKNRSSPKREERNTALNFHSYSSPDERRNVATKRERDRNNLLNNLPE